MGEIQYIFVAKLIFFGVLLCSLTLLPTSIYLGRLIITTQVNQIYKGKHIGENHTEHSIAK